SCALPCSGATNRLCRGHRRCRAFPANCHLACAPPRSRCPCRRARRPPRATLVCERTPPLFLPLLPYSFFLPCLDRQLLAEEFFQFIENAVPTFVVAIARLFARQFLVR